jgi:phage tail sheath gpL-like
METRRFAPLYSPSAGGVGGTLLPTVNVTAGVAATASTQFPGMSINQFVQILITNQTTTWAYVNFGVFGAVVAATLASSLPVAPNSSVIVSVNGEVTGASVILAATGAGTVSFTRGEGI